MAAESYAEAARKASNGNWRKPRMKIYDYNQEFGGNYYQPMISYIHEKDVQGPFTERRTIDMPDRAEVTSNKYSNMRYGDKSNTDLELEDFLVKSYKKQIKELNSATATTHRLIAHNSKDDTHFGRNHLLGYHLECDNDRRHYTKEMSGAHNLDLLREEQSFRRAQAAIAARERAAAEAEKWRKVYGEVEIDDVTKERMKDVRAKLYFAYRPVNFREFKEQWLE